MSLKIEIPDDVIAAIPGPESERGRYLMLELACALYACELLSLGRAAELARVSKVEFGREPGARDIARHYAEADLAADLAYARTDPV